jgi:hypothetical protein
MSFVVSSHQAHRFTQVKTISFHPDFSNSFISEIISSLDLEKCFPLFFTVRQNEQKLSQPD